MSDRSRHLPVSLPNAILVGTFAISGIVAAALQSWIVCAVSFVLVVAVVIPARLARRRESSDVARLNSMEYRDERDRALARSALAVVGGLALIVATAEMAVATAVHLSIPKVDWATGVYYVAFFQFLLFHGVWGRANRAATQEN